MRSLSIAGAAMALIIGVPACTASRGGPNVAKTDPETQITAPGSEGALLVSTTPADAALLVSTVPPDAASAGIGRCVGAYDIPAHETTAFVTPSDDGVVLSEIIDGAGSNITSTNPVIDAVAGNFCGGLEKELVLLRNGDANDFAVLRGPVPYLVGTQSDMSSSTAHPWRGVAAGDLDNDGYDEIIALRSVTDTGVPDLVVGKADPSTCSVGKPIASATIGNPGNSAWVDVAVGNFDGTGKQIALLKGSHTDLFIMRLQSGNLVDTYSTDLDANNASFPWKSMTTTDLDGDGHDELILARQVSDNLSPTVIAYKWTGSAFSVLATSTFGNDGNSAWVGIAGGDFNGDGRGAVALVKNAHSNFAVMSYDGTSTLRVTTNDMNTVSGQPWQAVAATDWYQNGDQGAAELLAIRAVSVPYRANIFVFGNSFNRAERDSSLREAQVAWGQARNGSPNAEPNDSLKAWLTNTHSNTIGWVLSECGDYSGLVELLKATSNFGVDGRQLRVWAILLPPGAATTGPPGNACQVPDGGSPFNCSYPEDSPSTSWNELSYFSADPSVNPSGLCNDYVGWGAALGRLAQQYPQLVGLEIDDYTHYINSTSQDVIAEMTSRMRQQAPWMVFTPTSYYGDLKNGAHPDITQTFDTMTYFFRNESDTTNGECISGACGDFSIFNLPSELSAMESLLPLGRQITVGLYFDTLYSSPPQTPSAEYDQKLLSAIQAQPGVGGIAAYTMQTNDPADIVCSPADATTNKYCTVQQAFGTQFCAAGETRPCGDCGTQTCGSDCTWGTTCSNQGVCPPGATMTEACGACGTRTDTCSSTCQWVTGTTCNGQNCSKVCNPGQQEACCPFGKGCACDGTKTCNSDGSAWGSCVGATVSGGRSC